MERFASVRATCTKYRGEATACMLGHQDACSKTAPLVAIACSLLFLQYTYQFSLWQSQASGLYRFKDEFETNAAGQ